VGEDRLADERENLQTGGAKLLPEFVGSKEVDPERETAVVEEAGAAVLEHAPQQLRIAGAGRGSNRHGPAVDGDDHCAARPGNPG